MLNVRCHKVAKGRASAVIRGTQGYAEQAAQLIERCARRSSSLHIAGANTPSRHVSWAT